jgi:hypothetical protein
MRRKSRRKNVDKLELFFGKDRLRQFKFDGPARAEVPFRIKQSARLKTFTSPRDRLLIRM